MKKYVAAIDQGTTSTRCILFDRQGNIVSVGQKEHEQIYPKPGWVEHNPDEIWKNTLEVIALARIKASADVGEVAAVGITNQRETTVVWNRRTGKAYHNALVWQDTRTGTLVAKYEKEGGIDRFRAITGLPLATYFSGLKLKWLLDNVDGLRADAEKGDALFGNMDSFLIWNLTGGAKSGIHVTDVTNASRTQLMNLRTLQWDASMLKAFDIPEAMLPAIKSSSEVYGHVASESLPGVPVAGALGDQHAALVGQACFEPGMAKNTYGTGCFLVMNTGDELQVSEKGLLTTIAYKFGDQPVQYALEGSIAIAGALVQWVRDNLGLIKKSSDIEQLAQSVADNGGAYFVPAFSGLYAPYWRNDARGVIAGLTRYVTKGHIARAVLEATAYQTVDVVNAMEEDSGIELKSLRVDGGMVANQMLMQFQSDMLNAQVVAPAVAETTALGAAYAAGLAVGYWKDLDDLRKNWAIAQTWNPNMEEAQRTELYNGWQKAVTKSFGWEE
ncbi:glycerol kinase GlpK [Persicitalea jodogahamensis]|uniref:Glycerol kinase n=1 Tax=Persicitalea jodogahamensis TaxID=402147 RepID=A0A8J3D4E7_9BACT|nr:glycerol kinase GlpK [Persicitalea jodogahamensis]GHB53013.1 glycerol kinase [Persicitalea jodogahamensis]